MVLDGHAHDLSSGLIRRRECKMSQMGGRRGVSKGAVLLLILNARPPTF